MKNETITQKELIELTGLQQCYISNALFTVSPISVDGRICHYKRDEAIEALIKYCSKWRDEVMCTFMTKLNRIDAILAKMENER